jgi:endonuclease/exonuclease/phosphatase family metal-dependent hydrolase
MNNLLTASKLHYRWRIHLWTYLLLPLVFLVTNQKLFATDQSPRNILLGSSAPTTDKDLNHEEPAPESIDPKHNTKSQGINLVTWNIEWYPGGSPFATREDRRRQHKLVGEVIKSLDPTILAAQEIRDWDAFHELCASVPNLQPVTVSFFPREEGGEYWQQQLALASKLRTRAAWSQGWSKVEQNLLSEKRSPRRGFSVGAFHLPKTRYLLLVYNIHLKSNRIDPGMDVEDIYAMREESIKQLLGHAKVMETTLFKNKIAGIIITGDFNTNQDGQFGDRTLQLVKDDGYYHTWEDTPPALRNTWIGNSRHQATCFDHVFTKYLGSPKSTLIATTRASSDHQPIKTVITHENYEISILVLDFLNELTRYQNLVSLSNPQYDKD